MLLVHDDRLRRQQLDRRREQPGGDRHEHVDLEAGQRVLEAHVAQGRELAVPALRDEQRLTFVERAGLRRRQVDPGHGRPRRAGTLADVDEVAHVDPLVDLVVRALAAPGDGHQADLVVAGQRVGLRDGRP